MTTSSGQGVRLSRYGVLIRILDKSWSPPYVLSSALLVKAQSHLAKNCMYMASVCLLQIDFQIKSHVLYSNEPFCIKIFLICDICILVKNYGSILLLSPPAN